MLGLRQSNVWLVHAWQGMRQQMYSAGFAAAALKPVQR
jgi:hypothetical protein